MAIDPLIVTEYLRLVSTCNTHTIMNESLPFASSSENVSKSL